MTLLRCIALLHGLAGCGGPTAPVVTITRVGPPAIATAPVLRTDQGTARAFEARQPDELPKGDAAGGELGDIVLRNDKLVAVVRAATHRGRVAPTGGHLIDLAPRDAPDALGEAVLFLDADARVMPVFTEVSVARDGRDGGLALVRAAGHDARDEQVKIEIDYILESGSDRLRTMTTVTHRGRSHYRDFTLGHWMSWGTLHPFVPGLGSDLEGQRTRSAWVGADGGSGAIVVSGVAGLLEATHGRDFSQIVETRNNLTPGSVLSWETSFYVAPGGGVAQGEHQLHRTRQTVTGEVHGVMTERRRRRPVSDGWVLVGASDGSWVTRARTDAQGAYSVHLEPGHYRLVPLAPGRPPGPPIAVRVSPDVAATKDLVVDAPGRLRIAVEDETGAPLPARAALVGRRGAISPSLGPANGMPLAGPFIHAAEGKYAGRIPPGEYDLTVGAGPAYSQVARAVSIRPGETTRVAVKLTREVDTAGLMALDPRVHTMHGATSSVAAAARLAACRMEGLDAVVATDERGGEPWRPNGVPGILALRGLELQTTDARLGALPLVTVPILPDRLPGGAAEAMPYLRSLPGSPLVAVFRPRGRALGYFEAFAFDPKTPALPRGGFSLEFDLLEVLSFGTGTDTDRAMADYLALVARGTRVLPLGASGSDDLSTQICGCPRTWVRANVTDAAGLEAAFRRGDVQASGGPIVRVQPQPQSPESSSGPGILVTVRSAGWLRPTTLEVLTDVGPTEAVNLEAGTGPMNLERVVALPVGAAWVVARVDGPRRAHALYPGGIRPLSITAPLRFAAQRESQAP